MKKNYVNLELQVVDVQLSDCIAGSVPPMVKVNEGTTFNNEVRGKSLGGGSTFKYGGW